MDLKGVQNFASSKVDLRKDLIVKQSVLKGLQSVWSCSIRLSLSNRLFFFGLQAQPSAIKRHLYEVFNMIDDANPTNKEEMFILN